MPQSKNRRPTPRPKKFTKKLVVTLFEDGRGHGTRAEYLPWQLVREFPSWGNQTRLPALIFDRVVQTFSNLERFMYMWLEFGWTPSFGSRGKRREDMKAAGLHLIAPMRDFRDQFPIDPSVTAEAAARSGTRHPVYPGTKIPVVMNTDGLVTRGWDDEHESLEIWDAKPKSERQSKRVLDKLALHTAFADHIEAPHHIFDETTATLYVLQNIDLMRGAMPNPYEDISPPDLFTTHLEGVLRMFPTKSRCSVSLICTSYDEAHSLEDGAALRVFWCLVWSKRLELDLDVKELEHTMACRVVRSED